VSAEGSTSSVPPVFGRFRVLHQIGAGSLGPVFRGEDPTNAGMVAIKVIQLNLPPERAHEVADGFRALQEWLPHHPAVAPVIEGGLQDVYPYVVSTLAPGQSLDVALREFGPAVLADALPRLTALAEGMDLAAESWTWHGDLHPRDIIIQDHDTTIVGLGVAPIVERTGARLPTRRPYTAPEVLNGRPTSPASDQYALAAMTFEWLYGKRAPGPTDSPLQVPPLSGADRQALAGAFTTALASDPAARFDSCSAFVAALGHAVRARDAVSPDHAPRREERREPVVALPLPVLPQLQVDSTSAATPEAEDLDGDLEDDDVEVPLAIPVDSVDDIKTPVPANEPDDELRLMPEPTPPFAAPGVEREVVEPAVARLAAPSAPARLAHTHEPRLFDQVAWEGSPESSRPPRRERRGFGLAALLVALAIGIALGAGGGFVLVRDGLLVLGTESSGRAYTDAPLAAATPPPDVPLSAATPPRDAARPPVKDEAPPESATAPASRIENPAAESEREGPASEGGSLLVRSTPPGAEVSIDGSSRGVTPLAVRDLPLGTHTVVLTRPGFARSEQRIALTRSRPSRSVDARLIFEREAAVASTPPPRLTSDPSPAPPRTTTPPATTGTLLIESRPAGAVITLNGREAGTTPLVLDAVARGPYTVRIERAGYQPWTTTVLVEAGARARVAASLESVQD
jgi:serine/threonine protein kinase